MRHHQLDFKAESGLICLGSSVSPVIVHRPDSDMMFAECSGNKLFLFWMTPNRGDSIMAVVQLVVTVSHHCHRVIGRLWHCTARDLQPASR
jgi:hypothetical protein